MPSIFNIPDNRPRRLTFRRILLALVLGLSTWWGVGWWLSPLPLYTLQFPFHGGIRFEHGSVRLGSWTAGTQYHFTAFPLDTVDRHLLVQLPHVPSEGRVTTQLYSLATGQLVSSFDLSADERRSRPGDLDSYNLHEFMRASDQGVLRVLEADNTHDETKRFALYEFNLKTGAIKKVSEWEPGCEVHLCANGAALVERREFPLFLPNLVAPASWGNCIPPALTQSYAELAGPAMLRLRDPATGDVRREWVAPSPAGCWTPHLSESGRWLFLGETRTSRKPMNHRGLGKAINNVEYLIFDLEQPGSLHCGLYPPHEATVSIRDRGPQLVLVHYFTPRAGQKPEPPTEQGGRAGPSVIGGGTGVSSAAIVQQSDIQDGFRSSSAAVVHLPSGRRIGEFGADADEYVLGAVQYGASNRAIYYGAKSQTYWVTKVNELGNQEVCASGPMEWGYAELIPETDQLILRRSTRWGLPTILADWCERVGLFQDVLKGEEFVVLDYIKQQEALRIPLGVAGQATGCEVSSSGRFMVVHRHDTKNDTIRLAVYGLPITIHSLWWPRSAGLLIAALVLFAHRMRRG